MRPLITDNYKAARATRLCRVFGDADQVRIVSAVLEQEMKIATLAETIGMTESTVSHHLRVLRQMRLLKARREGRKVYYSIEDPHIIAVFEQGIRYVEEERIATERFMADISEYDEKTMNVMDKQSCVFSKRDCTADACHLANGKLLRLVGEPEWHFFSTLDS